eukprot:7207074-Ditylum_brightwellii.AAC.1
MARCNNKCTMASLHETVQRLSVTFSDKWREHWHNIRIKQLNSANLNAPEHTLEKKDLSLNTGLKQEKSSHGPIGSTQLENFLKDVERDLVRKEVIRNKPTEESETVDDKMLRELFLDLEKNAIQSIVPTNKTNAHKVVDLKDYTKWFKDHLDENTKDDPPQRHSTTP